MARSRSYGAAVDNRQRRMQAAQNALLAVKRFRQRRVIAEHRNQQVRLAGRFSRRLHCFRAEDDELVHFVSIPVTG
nr:hypothetical protein [Paenibacillus aestuarii]